VDPTRYAFLGPLVGAAVRPVGGWIADKLGGARVTFWNFIVMVLGIAAVHKIGTGRAAVAVLLPTLVCCGLILAAVFALIAAAGGLTVLLEQAAQQQ